MPCQVFRACTQGLRKANLSCLLLWLQLFNHGAGPTTSFFRRKRQAAPCAMLRLVGVVAVAAAAKEGLCDKKNGSVPCAQLPHGVAMPMVALGSWRGSYKDRF